MLCTCVIGISCWAHVCSTDSPWLMVWWTLLNKFIIRVAIALYYHFLRLFKLLVGVHSHHVTGMNKQVICHNMISGSGKPRACLSPVTFHLLGNQKPKSSKFSVCLSVKSMLFPFHKVTVGPISMNLFSLLY